MMENPSLKPSMDDVEYGLECLEREIKDTPYRAIRNNSWNNKRCIHELIKCQAYDHGRKVGCNVFPEFKPVKGSSAGDRIDMGWFVDGEPVVGLEVDTLINGNSVRKLRKLPDDCIKVIVSKEGKHDSEEMIEEAKRLFDQKYDFDLWHIDAEVYKA